jgi:hypothetical protein
MGGCCSSSGSEAPLNTSPNSSANNKQKIKEDKIELAFKAKRANVFTEAIDIGRKNFIMRKIPKSDTQAKTICMSMNKLSFQII